MGSFPLDTSPFGVRDTVGNVSEMVESMDGRRVTRGGRFRFASGLEAWARTLDFTTGSGVGLRVCASAP